KAATPSLLFRAGQRSPKAHPETPALLQIDYFHDFLSLTAKLHPVYYDAPLLKTFAALYLNVSIYEMKISFAAPRQRLTWGDQWNVPHTNRTITWLKISRSILYAPA